ncbi:restriction endonuclease [Micrococcus luteus]|nr:restriction endonuclease [Micrococcus luteus]
MAKLLERLGYEDARSSNLNVRSDGVEVDIVAKHATTDQRAIAECKAYSSNVRVSVFSQFYGNLSVERLEDPDVFGYLFVLPGLTSDAWEKARHTMSKGSHLKVLDSKDISNLLVEKNLIKPIRGARYADEAVIVHATGTYSAAFELGDDRTPTSVKVDHHSGTVPEEVLESLRADPFSQSLPVHALRAANQEQIRAVTGNADTPLVLEIKGSTSDFEYQFPAAPQFFVGRSRLINELTEHVDAKNSPVVLNAQSGWGKSSAALKLAASVAGTGVVLDARTASAISYVPAALKYAAEKAVENKHLELVADASWATVRGSVESLVRSNWSDGKRLTVIFDQFENVFSYPDVTTAFRDLALLSSENPEVLTVGFAWKTDYVGWTEGHPFRLRDQIRESSKVVPLEPLGKSEIDTILRRLESAVESKLTTELKQRLREYSQGLPWLLKKLSSHILSEMKGGKSQETLLSEGLNVQELFESDLKGLSATEREALNFVAKFAPVGATEAMERHGADKIQSLIDQRFIVQVGDKLDTYWDIFRDYLNTGRVPIEDSYVIRQSPNSVARLVSELLAQGGAGDVSAIANSWDTTDKVVLNSAKELRQLGLASYSEGSIELVEEVSEAEDPESLLRDRLSQTLRRHRAWTVFGELAERGNGHVTVSPFASRLKEVFTAVEGTDNTWTQYARNFLGWFVYSALATREGQSYTVAPEGSGGSGFLTKRVPRAGAQSAFPMVPAGPALRMLMSWDGRRDVSRSERRSYNQLISLGLLVQDVATGEVSRDSKIMPEDEIDKKRLRELVSRAPGAAEAIGALDKDSSLNTIDAGRIFERAVGARWTDETAKLIGRHFMSWARAMGLKTRYGPRVAE